MQTLTGAVEIVPRAALYILKATSDIVDPFLTTLHVILVAFEGPAVIVSLVGAAWTPGGWRSLWPALMIALAIFQQARQLGL